MRDCNEEREKKKGREIKAKRGTKGKKETGKEETGRKLRKLKKKKGKRRKKSDKVKD